ncbi:hypothetical protein M8J76_009986 [Diaphorina citri]|nr:hypothetical protein M8J76_009986 [Diaphorina citri]
MVGKLGKLAAFFSSKPNLDTSSAYNSSYSVYQKPTCYEDDVKSLQNFQRRSRGWSSLRLNRKLQKGKQPSEFSQKPSDHYETRLELASISL